MDDAFALLPGDAIAVGTVDGRAFFGSMTFGSELARLVEKYLPVGQEAGFQASRDVDRVTFASYAFQGVDAAAVERPNVVRRLDEEPYVARVASRRSAPNQYARCSGSEDARCARRSVTVASVQNRK